MKSIAVTPDELKNLLYPTVTNKGCTNLELDRVKEWRKEDLFRWLRDRGFRCGCRDWGEYSRAKWALNDRYGWV